MWSRDDLVAELKALGLLRSHALERAFLRVRQEAFLPEAFGSLAYADMPLPIVAPLRGPTMPSARCLVSALDLLEPSEDLRILVAGGPRGASRRRPPPTRGRAAAPGNVRAGSQPGCDRAAPARAPSRGSGLPDRPRPGRA